MKTSLRGIAEKAKQDKHYRFGNLYGMLNKSALYCAWNGLNKKAAAGVDKETARTFSRELTENLDTLAEELRSKQYKARLVKQVGIPKGNGKLRMLGLPTLRDKIVQKAVADILSAIYEQDFLKCSYGYRPNVGAQTAVQDVTKELMKRYSYVVEADIKGFFDNIDHDWLMKMLEQRIKDKPFLGLIRKWLKAGILKTTGDVTHPETGCPQGVISPTLANMTLDGLRQELVQRLKDRKHRFIRYADDFIVIVKDEETARVTIGIINSFLEIRGLRLSETKTKITHITEGFDFLGWNFRKYRNGHLIIKPSAKSVKRFVESLKLIFHKMRTATRTNSSRPSIPESRDGATIMRV